MVPVVLKRTLAASPVYAVCAPLLKERVSLAGEIEGEASKAAVKLPVWLAMAELTKPLLLVIVEPPLMLDVLEEELLLELEEDLELELELDEETELEEEEDENDEVPPLMVGVV
jgi:hypothetical protein